MNEIRNRFCINLRTKMQTLIKAVGREDLRSVESLLIDMTGSSDAGRMLQHLLQWWPAAKNPDGWIYKSHLDWWAELRIDQKRLARAKGALEAVGVEITVKKANGSPTRHYRLHIRPFLKALARTLQTTLRKIFMQWRDNAIATIGEMDLANGGKSITHTLQQKQQQTRVCVIDPQTLQEVLYVFGMADGTARGLISQYGNGRVLAVARYAVRNRLGTGWVVKELRENAYGLGEADLTPAESWAETPTAVETPTTGGDVDTEVATPTLTAAPIHKTGPEKAWELALGQFKLQLDTNTFDLYMEGARFVRFEAGTMVVAVRNEAARKMLQHRMYRNVRRMVSDALAAPVELTFVVKEEVAA